MKIYKDGELLCYEDDSGKITCISTQQIEFENLGGGTVKVSVYKYREREHKTFYSKVLDVTELLDEGGSPHGTNFDQVLKKIFK